MSYRFTLFVAGATHRSNSAISNLRAACEQYPDADFELDIVDVLEAPERAEEDRIVATPTVIRELPLPRRRVIGDLSDLDALTRALELPQATFDGNKDGKVEA